MLLDEKYFSRLDDLLFTYDTRQQNGFTSEVWPANAPMLASLGLRRKVSLVRIDFSRVIFDLISKKVTGIASN